MNSFFIYTLPRTRCTFFLQTIYRYYKKLNIESYNLEEFFNKNLDYIDNKPYIKNYYIENSIIQYNLVPYVNQNISYRYKLLSSFNKFHFFKIGHNLEDNFIPLIYKYDYYIIERNLIDIFISWYHSVTTQQWYINDLNNVKYPKKNNIDYSYFKEFEVIYKLYKLNLNKLISIKPPIKYINYSEISTYKDVLKIMNLDSIDLDINSKKTPYDHKQYIKNLDEINKWVKTLFHI